MNAQTSLFDNGYYPVEKANELLDMINDGLKEKNKYRPNYYCEFEGYWLFMACNKEKDLLCNLLDNDGNTPNGFCVNWRNINHIKQELQL